MINACTILLVSKSKPAIRSREMTLIAKHHHSALEKQSHLHPVNDRRLGIVVGAVLVKIEFT